MSRKKLSLVQALAIVAGHPLRVRILSTLDNDGEASATSLAADFNGPSVAEVSYQLHVLSNDCGFIEPTRPCTEQGPDAEIPYRLKPGRPFQDTRLSGDSESAQVELFRLMATETAQAIDKGLLDTSEHGTFRVRTVALDPQGLTEVKGVLRDAMVRVRRIEKKSLRRLKGAKGEIVNALVGTAACRVEPLPDSSGAGA